MGNEELPLRWAIRDSHAHFVRFGTGCDGMFTHEAQLKKPKKLDRRVQRTRQLLQDALLAMVIEKGYDATTVQDIIDRANVGRATFYAHFPDKQTLLTSRLEDLRVLLTERRYRRRKLTASCVAW